MTIPLKQKIIGAVVVIGLILIVIFKFGLGGTQISLTDNVKNEQAKTNEPQLISTTPPELFEKKPMIFIPTQVIELHFNVELENGPETKLVLDPPHEFKVEISSDNKTARIVPLKPYTLGQGYTIFIKPDTKIKGGKTLGKGYDMQFNVINYSGI